MMSVVCKSGQSHSSALLMLRFSVLGDCSYGVFWIRIYKCDSSECYKTILGLGLRRAEGIHEGQLVGEFRLRLGVCLVGRRDTSGWWERNFAECLVG